MIHIHVKDQMGTVIPQSNTKEVGQKAHLLKWIAFHCFLSVFQTNLTNSTSQNSKGLPPNIIIINHVTWMLRSYKYEINSHQNQMNHVLYTSYILHVDIFTILDEVGKFAMVCDVFITINSHILKWQFLWGLTREIRKNKTTTKITMYTVHQTHS